MVLKRAGGVCVEFWPLLRGTLCNVCKNFGVSQWWGECSWDGVGRGRRCCLNTHGRTGQSLKTENCPFQRVNTVQVERPLWKQQIQHLTLVPVIGGKGCLLSLTFRPQICTLQVHFSYEGKALTYQI